MEPGRRTFLGGLLAMAPLAASGCATVFGKPVPKELRDKKRIRWGFVVLDLLWLVTVIGIPLIGLFLIIDFATGAIYGQREYSPLPDFDPDELEDLPDPDDQDAMGWLEVEGPVQLCDEATAVLVDGGPAHLPRWGRWLTHQHLAGCEACQRALTSTSPRRRVLVDGATHARVSAVSPGGPPAPRLGRH